MRFYFIQFTVGLSAHNPVVSGGASCIDPFSSFVISFVIHPSAGNLTFDHIKVKDF
jgi:hypothetical protein